MFRWRCFLFASRHVLLSRVFVSLRLFLKDSIGDCFLFSSSYYIFGTLLRFSYQVSCALLHYNAPFPVDLFVKNCCLCTYGSSRWANVCGIRCRFNLEFELPFELQGLVLLILRKLSSDGRVEIAFVTLGVRSCAPCRHTCFARACY